ncbi:MAG: hypothetical protein FRX48_04571 [Lasallia pustulata]|uniref:Uncharacterized protein n=1 Tax=Lasallia pustulata TaxID=136370 RepID=A0A5M8PRR9_9LECA|nr:MAG: hypothetical protein FRX48_04571 [Lasallia pustulata]
MAAYHQGANQHAFLEEDDDGDLTRVWVDLNLLISCVTTIDWPIGTPLGPKPIYLSFDGQLSEEDLTIPYNVKSAPLTEALDQTNSIESFGIAGTIVRHKVEPVVLVFGGKMLLGALSVELSLPYGKEAEERLGLGGLAVRQGLGKGDSIAGVGIMAL